MRKAVLLYNPLSGSRRARRLADVQAAENVLRSAGVEVSAVCTRGAAQAGTQAKEAIASGCDTIIACGGDGTIHDVLQGMVGTPGALGCIPLGTANCLAHDLGIPARPAAAARALLNAQPQPIALGRVECPDFTGKRAARFFTVAVGVGVDAHLFYKMNLIAKSRVGMAAYYAEGLRLWLSHTMPFFDVVYGESQLSQRARIRVSEMLAVRITEFGGLLRHLAPGAALARNDLRLVLFKTSNRLAYLRYILRGMLRQRWAVPGIELENARRVVCSYPDENRGASRIFVEADGELLGTLPAEISIVPNALTLLTPTSVARKPSLAHKEPSMYPQ